MYAVAHSRATEADEADFVIGITHARALLFRKERSIPERLH
jgi:hypothetical protein